MLVHDPPFDRSMPSAPCGAPPRRGDADVMVVTSARIDQARCVDSWTRAGADERDVSADETPAAPDRFPPRAIRHAAAETLREKDGAPRRRCTATIAKSRYDAVIFDLDGVVTQTAAVHAAAWKRLFDAYLAERAARAGTSPGGARRRRRRPPALRPRRRLRALRGRQAALRRRARLPRLARHRAADGRPLRPAGAGDGLRARQPQERLLQRRGRRARRQDVPLHRSSSSTSCATRASGSA